ncbi:MAG: exodeoxyribonuclease VII small subunit [Erysipelotrichaceae bacterium]|nr:exodeoxyribonuclease VII small subunit [Erysipelotrichaceae bacterium]
MENKSFEQYLQELEGILKMLDDKSISLEDAVKGYTKGLELSKKCYEILSSNEELVVKKMSESGIVDFNRE